MKSDTQVGAAGTPATLDITQCPDWGQGGQFVMDPVTGMRTRLGEPPAAPGELATSHAPSGDAAAAASAPTVALSTNSTQAEAVSNGDSTGTADAQPAGNKLKEKARG